MAMAFNLCDDVVFRLEFRFRPFRDGVRFWEETGTVHYNRSCESREVFHTIPDDGPRRLS